MKTKHVKAERPWMRKPARVPEKEWNFASVTDDEAPLCLLHEYGRAADTFKTQVAAWRKRNPQVCDAARKLIALIKQKGHTVESAKQFGAAWNSFIGTSWFGSQDTISSDGLSHTDHRPTLYYFPSFPDTPWLEIDAPIRKAAFYLLNPNTHQKVAQLPGAGAIQSPDIAGTLARQREIQKLMNAPDERATVGAIGALASR